MRSSTERNSVSCSFRSSDRPPGWRLLLFGMALVTVGCTESHDVPTERCLEVLAYRIPEHGEIGEIDTSGISDGGTVTIEFAAAKASRSDPLYDITCEYSAEDPWIMERVVLGGRELTEREIDLVNSDLLLRDLSLRPERFEESLVEPVLPPGDASPITPVSSAPPNPR